jgi:hypothetical protein
LPPTRPHEPGAQTVASIAAPLNSSSNTSLYEASTGAPVHEVEATQVAVVPPPVRAQLRFHGLVLETVVAAPVAQRLAVGALVRVWPSEVPHAPLTTLAPLPLLVVPLVRGSPDAAIQPVFCVRRSHQARPVRLPAAPVELPLEPKIPVGGGAGVGVALLVHSLAARWVSRCCIRVLTGAVPMPVERFQTPSVSL